MKHFIRKASLQGVSINNLTFHIPTHIYQSDASLNSLEFIAALLSTWMDAFHNDIGEESCLLCLADSSTATGWLKKSNFTGIEERLLN
jgi:hypothetical protein